MQLTTNLIDLILGANPGLDKYQIIYCLNNLGLRGITTHDLNAFIYSHQNRYEWRLGIGSQRMWYLKKDYDRWDIIVKTVEEKYEDAVQSVSFTSQVTLYPWQKRALESWKAEGYKGVIEAVTGAGKTRIAIQAAFDAIQSGLSVLVIVPTLELQKQWKSEFVRWKSTLNLVFDIGCLGGTKAPNKIHPSHVLISTVQSGVKYRLLQENQRGLIIADEVHHYGAEFWAKVLETGFERRLGLTATYEREDNGIEKILDPFFNGVVYSVDYNEALEDDVICNFKIAFIGVSFLPAEQFEYEDASLKAANYKKQLVEQYGLPNEPFGQFIREVHRLKNSNIPQGSKLAGFYLSAFSKRRACMANSSVKMEMVEKLGPAIRAAERTILFTQTKQAANKSVNLLKNQNIRGAVLTSSMDMDERHKIFAGFEDGIHELVAAPKLLDEGVDVPAADLAIILATSRSRRQLVQRMGRVIRKKKDGRTARIAIIYVEGTSEDPELGANEDFLDEVVPAAIDVKKFPVHSSLNSILEYLSSW